VGSYLAARLVGDGATVYVYDPNPRIPISHGLPIGDAVVPDGPVSFAASCVPADAVEAAAALADAAVEPNGVVFDWNTVAPSVKERVRDGLAGRMIDVALLDSLDAAVEQPLLAIAGESAEAAAVVLRRHGFGVSLVGDRVGDAASLKYLRSVFMKSLEALVLEYVSLAATVEGDAIVRHSLANNLGRPFVEFMDLLLATNRIHAERRGAELDDALETFASNGARPELANAAVHVLRQAAQAWSEQDAPPPGAALGTLASHLHRTLWPQPAAT
jgi:3-hydroxyisobutyrate dehydrogenase-like beta-hydroxyacid dehydrogenase